jgi:hypothetical protein
MKEASRLSFQYAEDSSVEGLELISQAWRHKMAGDSRFRSCLFHGFSTMCGATIE